MKPTEQNVTAPELTRFADACGFPADESHQAAFTRFQSRLAGLSLGARKLLAHITDLATRSRTSDRKTNTAYLPELHETCGLDVDAMYVLLRELERSLFIQLEGDYPFQDVLLLSDRETNWLVLTDLARFCSLEKISLRELIPEMKFEVLTSTK